MTTPQAWDTSSNRAMGISAKAEAYFAESLLTALELMDAAVTREKQAKLGKSKPDAMARHSGEEHRGN